MKDDFLIYGDSSSEDVEAPLLLLRLRLTTHTGVGSTLRGRWPKLVKLLGYLEVRDRIVD